jgi:hypothetical protein
MSELPSQSFIGARRSRELLREVAMLQRMAGRPAGLWPPLVVFGAAAILGAPLRLISDTATNLWWAAVSAPGLLLVARLYRRDGHQRGIERASPRLLVLGVASCAAGWVCCFALAQTTNLPDGADWALTVGLGYLAWSRLARSIPASVVAGTILAVGMALAWSSAPTWTVQLGVGFVMLAGSAALRFGSEAA